MAKPTFRSALATFCGVLVALLAAEIAMRPFSFQVNERRSMKVRQYQENISVSHFFRIDPISYWCRETGSDMIMGAENLVILGDSYLAARHISDNDTLGSRIEKSSREKGRPLNVIQCGLSGGSAATYAGAAEEMLSIWKPKWVIVLLNDSDFTKEVLNSAQFRPKVTRAGAPQVYKFVPPPKKFNFQALERNSSLYQTMRNRWQLITYLVAKAQEEDPEMRKTQERLLATIPSLSVDLLKQAYGNQLVVVFFPELNMSSKSKPLESELLLEKECLDEAIPFVSCRNDFIKLRQNHIWVRGFHNTRPGEGHMNEIGHRVVADVIWKFLNRLNQQTRPAQKKPSGEQS